MKSVKAIPLVGLMACVSACVDAVPPEPVSLSFLSEAPTADGLLSEAERALPSQPFPERYTFDNPEMDEPEISYRLGYTETHLYVAIETSADEVVYRNRGFLWGDGWRILLADMSQAPRSSLYADIYVSPKAPDDERPEIFLAVQDNDQVYRLLSDKTVAHEAVTETGTLFEATIAFDDIAPFHPLFDENIGVNLYFAKGFETSEAGPFPYGYNLIRDEGIWNEEIQDRAYVPVSLTPPIVKSDAPLALKLHSRSINAGDALGIDVFTNRDLAKTETVRWELREQDDAPFKSEVADVTFNPSSRIGGLRLPTDGVDPGRYELSVQGTNLDFTQTINLLPKFEKAVAQTIIDEAASILPAGDLQTFQFRVNDMDRRLTTLKPYADGEDILLDMMRLADDLSVLKEGRNPLEGRVGPYRRAFLSEQDGTLQPYSVRLPDDFDPDKTYPALVFLHGSGSDEQDLLDLPRSNGQFIEIAPFGRDLYYAYSKSESQFDIVEALDAASERFSIDRDRVLIGGFSMGGYGALRSFYENPELYIGVAVFAGHPNLANEWRFGLYPNFLKQKRLRDFENIPVFLYHGKQDAALPFELAEALSEALQIAGADVTYSWSDTNGHVYQDEETQARYEAWLTRFE